MTSSPSGRRHSDSPAARPDSARPDSARPDSGQPDADHPLAERLHQQLGDDAPLVALPERQPGRAVARAQTRRRNQRAVLVASAVVLVASAAVLPTLRSSGTSGTEGDVATQGGFLLPTGPLDLEWQRYEGGPGQAWGSFQDDQGVIYTLATAPGVASDDDGNTTRALYRLGDDGSWQPVVLDGETAPTALDAAAADGLLYAVSTGPGGDPGTDVARLSRSDDGGTTWTNEDLPEVEPPTTSIGWDRQRTLAVESHGSTTLALVTTTFSPADPAELFPEWSEGSDGDGGGSGRGDLVVEVVEDGLALVRPGNVEAPDELGRIIEAGPPTEEATATDVVAANSTGDDEVIRVISWSELGIDDPEALTPPSQIFRSGDDGWAPLDGPDVAYADLTVAGGRFVLLGSPTWSTPGPPVVTSEDGTSWSEVSLPAPGQVVGVNDVLVDVPEDFTGTIHASGDGGRAWQPIDLTATTTAGIAADSHVVAVSGGPLGLALLTMDSTDSWLVTSGDLADWTTTPLPEVTGIDDSATAAVFVGADRIVVRATPAGDGDGSLPPPATTTAIGVPTAAGD